MFLNRPLLHQKTLTHTRNRLRKKKLYTISLLYESQFEPTPETCYNKQFLQQNANIFMKQRVLMPNSCYTKRILHQNMFTPENL